MTHLYYTNINFYKLWLKILSGLFWKKTIDQIASAMETLLKTTQSFVFILILN